MVKNCLILAMLVASLSGTGLADEPTEFKRYSVCNAPDTACGLITKSENGSWIIQVFNKKRKSERWRSQFTHTGYPEGQLTETGDYFIVANPFYYLEEPVLYVYGEAGACSLQGKSFSVREDALVDTASHRLWMAQEKGRLTFPQPGLVEVKTIDGEQHLVKLADCQFLSVSGVPEHYQWLDEHGWVAEENGKFVVDAEVWERYERKALRSKRMGFVFSGLTFATGVAGSLLLAGVNNRTIFSPGSSFAEEVSSITLLYASGILFNAAAASWIQLGIAKKRMRINRSLYQPYFIAPQISRNGGGLEVAWSIPTPEGGE